MGRRRERDWKIWVKQEVIRNAPEKRTRMKMRMSRVAEGECLQRREEQLVAELGLGFDGLESFLCWWWLLVTGLESERDEEGAMATE